MNHCRMASCIDTSSSTKGCRRRESRGYNVSDCFGQSTLDRIALSVHRVISHRILLAVRIVPISWILDLEHHLVACSTLTRKKTVGEDTFPDTGTREDTTRQGSNCYPASHVGTVQANVAKHTRLSPKSCPAYNFRPVDLPSLFLSPTQPS
jgi:hypothetical protein